MSNRTGIEWTDRTWNPLVGCSKVSEGCRHCYAMVMASRIANAAQAALRAGKTLTGRQEAYRRVVRWRDGGMDPASADDVALREWNGRVVLDPDALAEPLSWRDPRRVFVSSMSDLFHERVPDEWIDRVFAVMALSPRHTFQVLTKRPERMRAWVHEYVGIETRASTVAREAEHAGGIVWDARDGEGRRPWPGWPLPNVWLGVSVEDQRTADERIPLLLQTPAAVRFVSYEPALGPVDSTSFLPAPCPGHVRAGHSCASCEGWSRGNALDWVIVGGESGHGARPFDVAWARQTIAACKAAGVACFVKQLGALPFEGDGKHRHLCGYVRIAPVICDEGFPCPHCGRETRQWAPMKLRDRKGGSMDEWPTDLRVREFPTARSCAT